MQSAGTQLDGSEVLLRRIPPETSARTTADLPDGGRRAASYQMSTQGNEEHLSCSRLCITTPRQLLDILRNYGKDPADGWLVCRFTVADVVELGLDIQFTPTNEDPGHCSITAAGGLAYPRNAGKRLAKRTRILTPDEIDELSKR